ncbi:MAG: hypothetical protein WB766_24475 [Roseiarcus sp.]
MSRRLTLGLALALGAASALASSAPAAVLDSAFIAPPSDQLLPVERAQFVLNGRNNGRRDCCVWWT